MTIDEMIAVLQAAKAGKRIECRLKEGDIWIDAKPDWDFDACDFADFDKAFWYTECSPEVILMIECIFLQYPLARFGLYAVVLD